ncbi:VOC family protein [Pseudomonas sp.]|uniref:VOC family protein n=1 Tax=Pseudomonas sp. TaxID=306 RepID=UPI0039829084
MSSGSIELDHVAIGVGRIAEVVDVVGGLMGGRRSSAGPGAGFLWAQWNYARGELLEVIEPDGPPGGFMHRFLKARGPGVHHVTFKVDDIKAARASAEEFGYQVTGYDDSNPGWKEMFLHPKQAGGIVVQFAQSAPELDESIWRGEWPFPEPSDEALAGGAPIELVRLVIAAPSEQQARRQWGQLLGGQECGGNGSLDYQWPGSPMRIRIETGPTESPGPVALEVRGLDTAGAGAASQALGIELKVQSSGTAT